MQSAKSLRALLISALFGLLFAATTVYGAGGSGQPSLSLTSPHDAHGLNEPATNRLTQLPPPGATPPPGSVASDRAALVALYNATDGDNWANNIGWLTDAPIGRWHGVTTDNNGRVTSLFLDSNQLTGAIPAELGNLSNLAGLDLVGNQLTGAIPAELGSLANLGRLDLEANQLTGAIPAELGNLSNLRVLFLGLNQLTGAIPAELGNLSNLERLYLYNNELTGAIPAKLGNLSNLETLLLSGNQLTGTIPAELGNLSNLRVLFLGLNQLTGAIPAELGNLSNLVSLELQSNQLTGTVPPGLGNLSNLEGLLLGGNQLTGAIPAELGNLSNLVDLYLGGNQLTGAIPAELGNLSNLEELELSTNQLTGAIPAELGDLSNLKRLYLFNNQLTGAIPTELGNLANLEWLFLHNNQFKGPLPSNFTQMTELEQFAFGGNASLCAPTDAVFQDWLQTIPNEGLPAGVEPLGPNCAETLPTIVFADMVWNSVQLQNRVARYIVENGYGHPTSLRFGNTLPLFQDLRDGDIDVKMEVWLPNLSLVWEEALEAGEVLSLGNSLGNDWQSAFVIPAYLQEQYPGLDSVEDLKDQQYQALFATSETGGKARLVSCPPQLSCARTNSAQIEGYGLSDYVHIVNPGSVAAMEADLYDAYESQEPWLGYQWGSNDPALLLDLVRLEEPAYSDECWRITKACAYEDATILIGVNSSLPERAPGVVEFLKQWDFNIDVHLRNVTRWQKANPDASIEDAAFYWLNSNADTWSGWVTADAADRILAALGEDALNAAPASGRIAFHSDRDGNYEIYVMNADGSGVTRLTNNSIDDLNPAWSPDGRRIAFHSDRDGNFEIYVMNADGSGVTRLTNNSAYDGDPAWSPDGARIAFESFRSPRDGNWEVYVMNADGSGVTRLTNNYSASDNNPTWSPDGTRIAFHSNSDFGFGGLNYEIYVMNADGSGVTRLTNNSAWDSEPSPGRPTARASPSDLNASRMISVTTGRST